MGNNILAKSETNLVARRWELFALVNGEVFFPLEMWPTEMKKTFFAKPISDKDTHKLTMFLIGNSCSYSVAAEWILSSNFWAKEKMVKRIVQLRWILKDVWNKRNKWFYFDLIHKMYFKLNGEDRKQFEN